MFLALGLLYIAVGIPLFLRKVKRNPIYGFRTQKTMSDDKYWFPVNQVTGKWFILCGVTIVVTDNALIFSAISENLHLWIMTTMLVIGTIVPAIVGFQLLKSIE